MRAVIDAPDDDAPRLAYASWLRAHGESERAEVIVLQCANSDRAATEALLAQHRSAWERPLGRAAQDVVWVRGFPEAVTLQYRNPRSLAVLDRAPIRWLWLRWDEDAGDDDDAPLALARTLAGDPRMARLHGTALTNGSWGEDGAMQLFASPHWGELRLVTFGDGDAHAYVAQALARCPSLRRLAELEVVGDYEGDFGDDGVQILAGAPQLATLRRLRLNNVALTERAAHALAESSVLTQLEDIDFGWGSYNHNQIGTAGAVAIAASPNFRKLQRIVLDHNGIGDAGLAALAASEHLPELRTISARAAAITDAGLHALAAGGGMPKLATLELTFNNAITGAGIAALAGAPRFAALETLWLRTCKIGAEGATAIARTPHATGLRDLNLHECGIDDAGGLELAGSAHLAGIERLKLSGNALSPATCERLRERFGDRVDTTGSNVIRERAATL